MLARVTFRRHVEGLQNLQNLRNLGFEGFEGTETEDLCTCLLTNTSVKSFCEWLGAGGWGKVDAEALENRVGFAAGVLKERMDCPREAR